MDGDLYDEFGNYIGPELSGSEQVRQPTMQHLAPRSWGAAYAIPSCHDLTVYRTHHRRRMTMSLRRGASP